MECRWDAALLQRAEQLPSELLHIIHHGDDEQYLNAITRASLDPRYTYILFAHCEDIFAHVCATLPKHGSLAATIATLGRVVPFAPYLMPYAQRLLSGEKYIFGQTLDHEEDLLYLLGLFRLFSHDWRTIRPFIKSTRIARLLESPSRPVVYLAIRILQIYLSGADYWFEQMVKRYLGEDTPESGIDGTWDDLTIDYRFLTLWEEERFRRISTLTKDAKSRSTTSDGTTVRILPPDAFDMSTAVLGGICLPRGPNAGPVMSAPDATLVHIPTINSNLHNLASALKSQQPILLSGLAGSGKTLIVRYVARELGVRNDMITLHLNEQSDAKLLIGIYTTADTPGSFVWKPGVLTQAVQEGRWVLIEDLDRAPNEIIGTLLPLIERGELMIPNRRETIHAAQGFRILATVRSTLNHRDEATKPLAHMLGARHWQNINIESPSVDELRNVASQLYPTLLMLLPQFISVFGRLTASRQRPTLIGQSRTGVLRSITPRDLLKWCGRVSQLLREKSSFTSQDIDGIFLEAMDCFVGALPDGPVRDDMAALIAEELRIDPQRRDYLVGDRDVKYETSKSTICVGRYNLPRSQVSKKPSQESFSTNPHTCRMLERVAAAVVSREPLLLVGETGVGKTTAVQHLASHLGKKLVPFNLSQQSEAGDLLGGFKPINSRTIIIPMKDEFDELFAAGFSRTKNAQFLELLAKQMSKSNWRAVCKLWRQALKMVDEQRPNTEMRPGEAPSKKRKVETKKRIDIPRWDAFAARLSYLERRLAAGSNAFAFSFVEGTIVKAVRNGDWVLLDEINLASPDTLESIAELFEPHSPSILLTESGSVERVDAHRDFRVFAAMNPATDVGKKDLPPGIRSRFTELYVESPDKDIKSLQSIVRSYLRHESANDQSIALDVSTLYQKIIGLAEQNRLVDGAGQKPHFSLRTLTRTLSYAKYIAPLCSLRRALYEGFHMSFLTFLDAESSRLVEPLLEQQLLGKRTNVRAEISKSLRMPNDGSKYVQGYPTSKHWIRKGNFAIEEQPHYILTPFIRRNLENLIRASSTRKFPVLIQGPTSSGKTSMIEYLAKRSGHKFVRVNNHEHTDLQEYLGTYVSGADGRLQFQEGILVKALREGHWIVLDELNLAPTDVLEALNRLLDDNRELLIPETQEVVRPHGDFMLFATQNPAGLYGGRKTLSRAFRNRFLELHFDDIPIDELQEILHKRTQLPESRTKRIVNVYKELSVLRQESRMFEQRSFATLRDLFRWALRPNDTIEQLAANGFMLLAERVRKDEERQILKGIIERSMSADGPRVHIDEDALYAQNSPELLQYQQVAGDVGVVWTKAMRRLYSLVARAIHNNEPVLLVGETGCGKTTVCQMLADAFSKALHTINAHQNTETGDIIGSQRPVRNRAVIEASLRHALLTSELLRTLDTAAAHSTDALLDSYDRAFTSLSVSEKAAYGQSLEHQDIQPTRTRLKALFEWADGSLVEAMKTGTFFLLDEISLADDSVLERINSVLESQRSILLAEKGSLDSYVTAAPDFQFFATMNPGGDYGKRELSPALRNRFTEIWVPPLNDVDDITQIVSSKLVEGAKPYANAVVAFAQWFNGRYNTSASSSISIRDALSWVSFINTRTTDNVAVSIIHGAAMVYIDTLGANPAGLMTMSTSNIERERRDCLSQLGELLHFNAHGIYAAPIDVNIALDRVSVGIFSIPKHVAGLLSQSPFSFEPPTTRTNAMRVVRALQLPKPVLLEGNPGVGKTALVTAIANTVGMPLTRINLSEQTDLLDLFGSDVPVEGSEAGTFTWRDAPFLRAMKNGEWVLLDEMNLASQSVLEGLNACLDHRGEVFVPELGQVFTRHPNFRLFAAQNPHHQGGGRKGLPASFVNRFTVVFADAFRADDLVLISRWLFPGIEPATIERVISFVEQLDHEVVQRKRIGANGGPWEFNLRDVSRWLALASSDQGLLQSGTPLDFVDFLFGQRFRSDSDKEYVRALFDRTFQQNQPGSDLFPSLSSRTIQIGLGILPRDQSNASTAQSLGIRPQTDLGITQSFMLCVQQNWPVILTGATGTGKTALVERIAAAVGAQITTIPLNADSDSMDLIGGFEQADPHRQTSHTLGKIRTRLGFLAKASVTKQSSSGLLALVDVNDATTLPAKLSSIQASEFGEAADEINETLSVLRQTQHPIIDKAQFQWIDGLLVEALQRGRWLVLDNANLCSPSVLDRLNSLLEHNGTLMLNEHSGEDGSPRTIIPHPSFRIFLLYDPRFGELSRAMRNRAVELHLSDSSSKPLSYGIDHLNPESAMARLRYSRLLSSAPDSNARDFNVRNILADHIATNDAALRSRFCNQLRHGLYQANDLDVAFGTAYQAAVQSALTAGVASESTLGQSQVSADFTFVQTFHPLNNQARMRTDQASKSRAHSAAFVYDLLVHASFGFAALDAVQQNPSRVAAIRRLEGAAQPHDKRSRIDERGSVLLNALRSSFESLVSHSRTEIGSVESTAQMRRATTYMISTWLLLARYLAGRSLDIVTLATYWATASRISKSHALEAPSTQLATSCDILRPSSGLEDLQQRTCSVLWRTLRPEVPATVEHLEHLLKFEAVVERFDHICHSFQLPLEVMIELRLSFARVLAIGTSGDQDFGRLLVALENALIASAVKDPSQEADIQPHFAHTFQQLIASFAMVDIEGGDIEQHDLASVELLALRKTRSNICLSQRPNESPIHRQLRLLGIVVEPVLQQYGDGPTDHTLLIEQLQRTNEVSISRVPLLDDEVRVLGKVLASGACNISGAHPQLLDPTLRSLVDQTLCALLDGVDDPTQVVYARQLLKVLRDGASTDGTIHSPQNGAETATRTSWTLLKRAVDYFVALNTNGKNEMERAAEAWAAFSIACLQFYLPTSQYDPALDARFRHDSHREVNEHILRQLQALTNFRRGLTGVTDVIRTRVLQEDLSALGPAPSFNDVCRPNVSRLLDLQPDIDALQRTLKPLLSPATPLASSLPLNGSAMSKIVRIRSRLEDGYREYDDFTSPVISLIDCLLIAQHLANSQIEPGDATPIDHSSLIPFAGASWEHWTADNYFIDSARVSRTWEEKLNWLSIVVIRTAIFPLLDCSSGMLEAVEMTLRSFYYQWRTELDKGQKEAAAKSNLYKFKGQDEADETTVEDLEALFPMGTGTISNDASSRTTHQAQELAPQVAGLHSRLFVAQSIHTNSLLELLTKLPTTSKLGKPLVFDEATVPSLVLMIGSLQAELSDQTKAKSYNIYKDANPTEVRRLLGRVQKTSKRFSELHEAFPEHATPMEVLRLCEDILQVSRATTLGQLLPRVEKLRAAVIQWQDIASREHGVVEVVEMLTNLIVGWRQLELSSWAGLFDAEWRQAQKDAASWWYIAYENIIAALPDVTSTKATAQHGLRDLIEALTGFLTSSGMGEYHARLDILRGFEEHLRICRDSNPHYDARYHALQNFNTYYNRFMPKIESTLAEARQGLEKEIKNVIQIASWKDRNIEVLRQSAHSSHKKLLRLVRKFRTLLAQPVMPIIAAGAPSSIKLPPSSNFAAVLPKEASHSQQPAPDIPQLSAWVRRPARFRHINATSSTMHDESSYAVHSFDLSQQLQSFGNELKGSVLELQKATPAILTEENKSLVTHLKTRKRRLLAWVFRQMRTIGFQSSISDVVLSNQQSLSVVFSYLPILGQSKAMPNIETASHAFYQLLGVMPAVRDAARKHSDDLTAAEASRCLSLLESLLFTSVTHHIAVASAIEQFNYLEQPLTRLRNFGHCGSPSLSRRGPDDIRTESAQLSMVNSVLCASQAILQQQATLSGNDYSSIINRLQATERDLTQLSTKLKDAPALPPGTQSDDDGKLLGDTKVFMEDLQAVARQGIATHLETAPVLSHISRWAAKSESQDHLQTNAHIQSQPSEWTGALMGVLDKLVAAVQNARRIATEARKAQDSGNLLQQQAVQHKVLDALHLARLADELQAINVALPLIELNEDVPLDTVASVVKAVCPIIDEFHECATNVLRSALDWHMQLNGTGHSLALSFIQLAERGFCTPSETPSDSSGQSEEVESGTGLGDGEGAENISKDIGDDEDISELAQGEQSRTNQEDPKDEKDAVDMADEEFNGDIGDVLPESEEEGGKLEDQSEAESDVEEQPGDGDMGSDALDEKMWDANAEEGKQQQESERQKGKSRQEDDATAAGQQAQDVSTDNEDDVAQRDMEELVDSEQHPLEKMDPYTNEENNLELPEDINMDGNKESKDEISDADSISADEGSVDESGGMEVDEHPDEPQANDGMEDEGETYQDERKPTEFDEQAEEEPDVGPEDLMQDGGEAAADPVERQDTFADDGNGPEKASDSAQMSGIPHDDEDTEPVSNTPPNGDTSVGTGAPEGKDNTGESSQDTAEDRLTSSFRQLGDILEQWYDQHRDIAQGQISDAPKETQQEMSGSRFEHLPDQDAEADTQALGAASLEQSAPLNKRNAISADDDDPVPPSEETTPVEGDGSPNDELDNDPANTDAEMSSRQTAQSTSVIGERRNGDVDTAMEDDTPMQDLDEVQDVDERLTNTHISHEEIDAERPLVDHQQLWAQHEANTRNLALVLTEHLRLILHPTQATRMRGDFRTGKRLNIKRIIPYIASSYKRDKIWMRRSVPSKRSYQVMLAIDDSESMTESQSKQLAFETLALIAKSMSMLEVGELSVVSFGEEMNVAHDFSTPFTADAGPKILKHFTFEQDKTNVQKLLSESIEIFRSARLKAAGSASNLWQLQLIISDGICENHSAIRQLIRQAHEERIMVVFIVVDPAALSASSANDRESILDMPTANFFKDDSGEMQLEMGKYLDTFPFRYYLIVRDVQDLPGVLAGALRQWFAETVDAGG